MPGRAQATPGLLEAAMAEPTALEPPTNPLGNAICLVMEIDVGVTTAAALKGWRPGDVLRLPVMPDQPVRVRAGRHLVAVGTMSRLAGDRLELCITHVV